jgi:hypothetical protein
VIAREYLSTYERGEEREGAEEVNRKSKSIRQGGVAMPEELGRRHRVVVVTDFF